MSVCFNREQSNTWNPYNIGGIITGPARSHPVPPPSAINTIKEGGFRHRYHTHTHPCFLQAHTCALAAIKSSFTGFSQVK